jgi:hypothetical protein
MSEEILPQNPEKIIQGLDKPDVSSKMKSDMWKTIIAFLIMVGTIVFAVNQLFTEPKPTPTLNNTTNPTPESSYIEGYQRYIDPYSAPEEGISYELVDSKKNHIIYLKATDDKLVHTENLFIKVKGFETRTKEGDKVLLVKEIEISN